MFFKARYKDGIMRDNKFYYFDECFQMLCVVNLDDCGIKIIKRFEEDKFEVRKVYFDGINFYFVGWMVSQGIHIYNVEKDELKEYLTRNSQLAENERWSPFFTDKYIYLCCRNSERNLIAFDLAGKKYIEMKSIANIRDDIEKFQIYFPTFFSGILSFVIPDKNRVLLYDVAEQKIDDCKIEANNPYIVLLETNRIWAVAQNGELVCKEGVSQKSIQLKIKKPMWTFLLSKYICVTSEWENKVVLIDKYDFDVKNIMLPIDDNDRESFLGGSKFGNCFETEEYIYLVPGNASRMYRIIKESLKAEAVDLLYDCQVIQEIMLSLAGKILVENKEVSLDNFKEIIFSDYKRVNRAGRNEGSKIWNYLNSL